MLDSKLHGTDGQRTYEQGAQGQAIPTADEVITQPVAGQGVQLTINRDIQYVAQRAIATRVREAKADSGTVIVMEAKTGRILAMATAPTFDPNNYGKAKAANLGNRPVSGDLRAGLHRQGPDDVRGPRGGQGQAALEDGGAPDPDPRRAHDPRPEDHGTLHLTLNGVLAQSSNIGTILFADKIGGPTLYAYQRKFGIGQPTGLGFPGEEQGILPKSGELVAHHVPGAGLRPELLADLPAGRQRLPDDRQRRCAPDASAHRRLRQRRRHASSPHPPSRACEWSARRRPGRCRRCWRTWSRRAPASWRRSRATGWRARPAPPSVPSRGGYSGYSASFIGLRAGRRPCRSSCR